MSDYKNHDTDEKKKERILETHRRFNRLHPEKNAEYKRRYYAKNRAKVLARERERYYEDVELTREKKRLWRHGKIEEVRAKERIREEQGKKLLKLRESRRANRPVWHCYSLKQVAKTKGVQFNLTPQWIKERYEAGVCEMSGLPFDFVTRRGPNTPSVDRREPRGGYTIENCRMVLWSINRALAAYGEAYMLEVFRKVLERNGSQSCPSPRVDG